MTNFYSEKTGLRRGDAAEIARRYGCTRNHVVAVASGERVGNKRLNALIRFFRRGAKVHAQFDAAKRARDGKGET